jgi:hypothetical protein
VETLLYFSLLAIMAEVLGTIGGFGSSLFFVPLAGFFFDFQSVLGITALFHLASNLSKIALFRHGFNKRLILQMGIPSLALVIPGAFLARDLNSNILETVLAFFLIAISLILLCFKHLVIRPTVLNAMAGGAASGFSAGLLGTGGAIRGLTMAAFNLEKEIFVATSAVIDFGVDFSRAVVYFSNGFMHKHDLYLVPVLLVVSVIGTYTGKKILQHFSQAQFRTLVLGLILIVGIIFLAKTMLFVSFA